jgi:uncharacterized protein (TIGR02757 family)
MRQPGITKETLEDLYKKYNRYGFIHPDPLEFVYKYRDPLDQEIVGLIASSLAYGRVEQILKSVAKVLDQMGSSPRSFLDGITKKELDDRFSSFKHRFTTGREISSFLWAIKKIINTHGSLEICFLKRLKNDDETVLSALTCFVEEICKVSEESYSSLISCPAKGSALKRFNLFLRWMVRKDDVDPGIWTDVPASKLIIPLDTHMHKLSLGLGFTHRSQADMRTALDITAAFRKITPKDPVKYDFVLTRFGILRDTHLDQDEVFSSTYQKFIQGDCYG